MDLESIAWIQTRLAKYRGLMRAATYEGIIERLNLIHGESTSLKSQLGHATAEIEILRNERDGLASRVAELMATVEAKSIIETDEAIVKVVEATKDIDPGAMPHDVSNSIENGTTEAAL